MFYDSCVNSLSDPSIFVVFEKHQVYPEYLIQYKEEAQPSAISVSESMSPQRPHVSSNLPGTHLVTSPTPADTASLAGGVSLFGAHAGAPLSPAGASKGVSWHTGPTSPPPARRSAPTTTGHPSSSSTLSTSKPVMPRPLSKPMDHSCSFTPEMGIPDATHKNLQSVTTTTTMPSPA